MFNGMRVRQRQRREGRGETEKGTERDCSFNRPLCVSIQAPTCVLPERASEGGSTLSTALQGDQAWKPASCASFLGPQPTDGTSTHASTSIQKSAISACSQWDISWQQENKGENIVRCSDFQPLHDIRFESPSLL